MQNSAGNGPANLLGRQKTAVEFSENSRKVVLVCDDAELDMRDVVSDVLERNAVVRVDLV